MTRIGTGEPQYVAAQNNIFTVLAIVATILQFIVWLWLLFVRWPQVLEKGAFG